MAEEQEQLAAIKNDLLWITKTLAEMKGDFAKVSSDAERLYVTKAEFEPVKRLVYGVVMLILSAVVMALIAQVVVSK